MPQVKGGKLRALGYSTAEAQPASCPTCRPSTEAGVKGYDMGYWFAAYVPAGTPAPVVERLRELLVTAVRSPQAKGFFDTSGAEAWTTTPAELGSFQASETTKWGRVIKAAGIEPE